MRRNRTTARSLAHQPSRATLPANDKDDKPSAFRTHSVIRRFLRSYDPNATPEQRVQFARATFALIMRDKAALAALAARGCDAAYLQAGQELLERADLSLRRKRLFHHALIATRKTDAMLQAHAFESYRRCLIRVRKALQALPEVATLPDFTPPRRPHVALWQAHAQQLHERVAGDEALAELLVEYAVSNKLIAIIQRHLVTAASGRELRHTAQWRARIASQANLRAMDALDYWMERFLALARIALAQQQAPLATTPAPPTA